MNLFTTLDFFVFGSFPICFSNGDFPFFFSFTLRAYRISDGPDLSLVWTICLFARKRSIIVPVSRSILPFPYILSPGTLPVLFRSVYRTVRMLRLETPYMDSFVFLFVTSYCAIFRSKNSTTFSL